jgi:asparagine synthase (glutamine-hydrolysing)
LQLVSAALRQVIGRNDAPIFALVPKEKLQQLLDMDFAWPWYGQLMSRPQTIAYMLQINFWLKHYHISVS